MEIKKLKAVRDEFPLKLMFQLGEEISHKFGRLLGGIRSTPGLIPKKLIGFSYIEMRQLTEN